MEALSKAVITRMEDLAHERKMTINQIIIKGGLTQSTISYIRNGQSKYPQVSTIYKFCKAINISLKDFFDCELFDELI